MAYLAFQDLGGAAAVRHAYRAAPAPDPVPAADDRLTALEWSVVALARRDSRSSLRQPGRTATAIRALFNRPNPKLADERLEAVRRMAVLTWADGYAVSAAEVRAFLDAGFTAGQYETMVDSIGAAKARARRTAKAGVGR